MFLRTAIAVVPLALAACASTDSETSVALSGELSQKVIADSFRTAVVDVCLASIMGDTPVSNLATETGPIVPETDAAMIRLAGAKTGDTVWALRSAKGAVAIKANAGACQVNAYGSPVASTFESVRLALSDPHGFVLDPRPPPQAGAQRHTRKIGDKLFSVTLSGSEPGTLVGVVTSSPSA